MLIVIYCNLLEFIRKFLYRYDIFLLIYICMNEVRGAIKMRVVIADDNDMQVQLLKELVESDDEIEVVSTASDGKEVCDQIVEYEPDVVLLDIVMPMMDGFNVLERIQSSTDIRKKPIVIVISAISKSEMADTALKLGADYYLLKPIDKESLIKRMKQLYSSSMYYKEVHNFEKPKKEELTEFDLEMKVSNLLKQMGVPVNVKGYRYLIDAIIMTYNDRDLITAITKQLYPEVAKKHHSTWFKIERDIRSAIDSTWKRGNMEFIKTIFIGNRENRPTNSEFIAIVVEKIYQDNGMR